MDDTANQKLPNRNLQGSGLKRQYPIISSAVNLFDSEWLFSSLFRVSTKNNLFADWDQEVDSRPGNEAAAEDITISAEESGGYGGILKAGRKPQEYWAKKVDGEQIHTLFDYKSN